MRAGEEWARPTGGAPALEVEGDDADLARAVQAHPGALIAYRPRQPSDVGMGIGLRPGSQPAGRLAVAMDLLVVGERIALSSVVVGIPPDQAARWHRRRPVRVQADRRDLSGSATGVLVATGQWWHGLDLVPRGHPGDGRCEVQVYGLAPGERPEMRRRLGSGTHVPHPRVREATVRRCTIEGLEGRPLWIDGRRADRAGRTITVEVRPDAYRLVL